VERADTGRHPTPRAYASTTAALFLTRIQSASRRSIPNSWTFSHPSKNPPELDDAQSHVVSELPVGSDHVGGQRVRIADLSHESFLGREVQHSEVQDHVEDSQHLGFRSPHGLQLIKKVDDLAVLAVYHLVAGRKRFVPAALHKADAPLSRLSFESSHSAGV